MGSCLPSAPRRAYPWYLLVLTLGAAGCEMLTFADRDLIPGADGGVGAGTTTSTGGMECIKPIDCPDTGAACVARTCAAGRCGTTLVAEGTPTSNQAAGDCKRAVCDGDGDEVLVVDDLDVPVDGDPCTDDRCAAGVASNPPSPPSRPCEGDGGAVCDGAGHCVECVTEAHCPPDVDCINNLCRTCFNGVQDGVETDADCGGPSCDPCGDGMGCDVADDCQSTLCSATSNTCSPSTCDDLVVNGDETDVDCGGSCPQKCGLGLVCSIDADCIGSACQGGKCAPSCTDGVQDNLETDVDCGGGTCSGCGTGKVCLTVSDCLSLVCATGACAAPLCDDGVKNGGESDTDCGGPCQGCPIGGPCVVGGDCESLHCEALVCAPPTCFDHAANGNETGEDCGGPDCGKCPVGQGCNGDTDCASDICRTGVCKAPSCTDGLLNQGEADTDCGGPCALCGGGKHCAKGGDCLSLVCDVNGQCTTPTCTDALKNGYETDKDCGGPDCNGCLLGKGCLAHDDCQSNACFGHLCVPPTCTDGVENGVETDTDCGGSTCQPCGPGQGCLVSSDCASPNTCGGGGVPDACGCTSASTATTCQYECGLLEDNCGIPVDCGICSPPVVAGTVTVRGNLFTSQHLTSHTGQDVYLTVLDGPPELKNVYNSIIAHHYPTDKSMDGDVARNLANQFMTRLTYRVDGPLQAALYGETQWAAQSIYELTGQISVSNGETWFTVSGYSSGYSFPYPPHMMEPDVPLVDLSQLGQPPLVLDVGTLTLKFIYLPPGRFFMGEPYYMNISWQEDPPHMVTLTKGYYLAEIPITYGLYLEATGVDLRTKGEPLDVAANISCAQAYTFCNALATSSGLKVRPPTSAELVYALRVGTSNTPFKEKVTATMWTPIDAPVKSVPPNPWGFYQWMTNVGWERSGDAPVSEHMDVVDPVYTPSQDPLNATTHHHHAGFGMANYPIGEFEYIPSSAGTLYPPHIRERVVVEP